MLFLNTLKKFNQNLNAEKVIRKMTALSSYLKKLSQSVKHSSLVVLISDFYDFDEVALKYVKSMAMKNDVIAVLIRDDLEMQLPDVDNWVCTDGSEHIYLSTKNEKNLKTDYKDEVSKELSDLKSKLAAYKIPLIKYGTDKEIWQQIQGLRS